MLHEGYIVWLYLTPLSSYLLTTYSTLIDVIRISMDLFSLLYREYPPANDCWTHGEDRPPPGANMFEKNPAEVPICMAVW